MARADFHVSLRLASRVPGSELRQELEAAARAGAEAVAEYLAAVDFAGRSVSVDYGVELGVRTVPEQTPSGPSVVSFFPEAPFAEDSGINETSGRPEPSDDVDFEADSE